MRLWSRRESVSRENPKDTRRIMVNELIRRKLIEREPTDFKAPGRQVQDVRHRLIIVDVHDFVRPGKWAEWWGQAVRRLPWIRADPTRMDLPEKPAFVHGGYRRLTPKTAKMVVLVEQRRPSNRRIVNEGRPQDDTDLESADAGRLNGSGITILGVVRRPDFGPASFAVLSDEQIRKINRVLTIQTYPEGPEVSDQGKENPLRQHTHVHRIQNEKFKEEVTRRVMRAMNEADRSASEP